MNPWMLATRPAGGIPSEPSVKSTSDWYLLLPEPGTRRHPLAAIPQSGSSVATIGSPAGGGRRWPLSRDDVCPGGTALDHRGPPSDGPEAARVRSSVGGSALVELVRGAVERTSVDGGHDAVPRDPTPKVSISKHSARGRPRNRPSSDTYLLTFASTRRGSGDLSGVKHGLR